MAKRHPQPPSESVRQQGILSAAQLEPIQRRLTACSGLFATAARDISEKLIHIGAAHRYQSTGCDAEVLESIRESSAELRNSSKLGRAIEDLEAVRASIVAILASLNQVQKG
jgi:hypothetical protein